MGFSYDFVESDHEKAVVFISESKRPTESETIERGRHFNKEAELTV